jgi:hypothetical protein
MFRIVSISLILTLACQLAAGREWTDAAGKYRVEAEYVGQEAGQVTLRKADGQAVTLGIEALSAGDQRYLAERRGEKERTWTATSGQQLQALLLAAAQGQVRLRRPDGQLLAVKLSLLSEEDRAHVAAVFGAGEVAGQAGAEPTTDPGDLAAPKTTASRDESPRKPGTKPGLASGPARTLGADAAWARISGVRGRDLAFTPDGKLLAIAAAGDDSVVLWDMDRHAEAARASGLKYETGCLAVSGDGKWLVAGDGSARIKLWSLPDATLQAAAFSQGRVGSIPSAEETAHGTMIDGLAFSPADHLIASVGPTLTDAYSAIRLWSIEGRLIEDIPLHRMRVKHVAFAADGNTLVAAGYAMVNIGPQRNALVRRPPVGGVTKSIQFEAAPESISALAVGADGKALYVSVAHEGRPKRGGAAGGRQAAGAQPAKPAPPPPAGLIARWDIAAPDSNRWRVTGTIGLATEALSLALSPDGSLLVAGCRDGTAVVCDSTRGRTVVTLAHETPVDAVAFSPDGRFVATGGSSAVLLWDLQAPAP